ncbi:MAG: leucine-rich repeat domain-containing protein, partial [Verrucomicrobiae bacterium]|nr:leucine-rich repeat domain-containing protein [Verrucomicrobiae bacterium]
SLNSLDCSDTRVSDLSPLVNLPSLTSLDCSSTKVQDICPVLEIDSLRSVDAFRCPISVLTKQMDLSKLESLQIGGTEIRLPEVLPEVLSQSAGDNCRDRLVDYFADLGEDPVQFDHVKVILLGNGRIGKTQIARRLRQLNYDPSEPSTHGIQVNSHRFQLRAGITATLNLWDFGGQDIYHGTHALFLKTRAIFVIVWTPDSETGHSQDPDGTQYPNEPLSYWIDYVEKLGGENSPVILVQNQCDNNETPIPRQRLPGVESYEGFLNPPANGDERTIPRQIADVGISAKDGSHWEKFETALKDSVAALWDHSHPQIGRSRLALWEQLDGWRAEDQARPKADQKRQKIEWEEYQKEIENHQITGPEGFAEVLHNAGMVFWKKELFDRALILRQDWCLDAIYAVLNRDRVLKQVRAQHGIFTQQDLDVWVWGEAGHSKAEQKQFLEMMQSCGICFSIGGHGDDEEFIAPELLPLRKDTFAAKGWDLIPEKPEEVRFKFSFLAPGVSRSVLSKLGKLVRQNGVYWKYGVFFLGEDGTAIVVEEVLDPDSPTREGAIVLRSKGKSSARLRSHVASLVKEALADTSPQPVISESSKWDVIDFGEKEPREFHARPPQSELEWTSERVRNAMRPSSWRNLYVLGSLDKRITFYAQQVRAFRLIQALAEEPGFDEKKIAIVGGGVAGITAAAAAAVAGCSKIVLFEERSQILQMQAPGSHRFIHPHIYQWPAPESLTKETAEIPLLDWGAANADEVVKSISKSLDELAIASRTEGEKRISIRTETDVESFRQQRDQIEVYTKDCFCSEVFDIVILTSGFGLEADHPKGVPNASYWRPDHLEGPFSFQNPERILVSGTGDGGLIDLVRATIHTGDNDFGPHFFSHQKAVARLCATGPFRLLGIELEKIDQRYRMAAQTASANYDLRKHYHRAFRKFDQCDNIVDAMKKLKRKDTDVWFNYKDVGEVFNLNSSLLNRVLVFLLIESGLIKPFRGRIEECKEEQDLYAVRMKGRKDFEAQRFNRVILRFGPDKQYLEKRFPELEGSTDELRDKSLLFPITQLPKRTKDFFEEKLKRGRET